MPYLGTANSHRDPTTLQQTQYSQGTHLGTYTVPQHTTKVVAFIIIWSSWPLYYHPRLLSRNHHSADDIRIPRM